MSRNLGKHDEGTGDYVFVELITRIPSHCIQVCYKRRRKTMKHPYRAGSAQLC